MIKARCDVCGADCSFNYEQLRKRKVGGGDVCPTCWTAFQHVRDLQRDDPRYRKEMNRRDRWDQYYIRRIWAEVRRARRLEIEAAKT